MAGAKTGNDRHLADGRHGLSVATAGRGRLVKVGDNVTDGTLCIIEAMKTMNPVPSPVAGRIAEIFVRDGQPVEFGEPLMRIE